MTDYRRRHLRFGWWSLVVFAALGFSLELLHAFKAGLYLDVASDTRRLMWTLAHAHGIGLGLVHIAFALSAAADDRRMRLASSCLIAATVLLPGGFFLGGVSFYSGDTGVGAALIPVGGVLLLVALVTAARAVTAASR